MKARSPKLRRLDGGMLSRPVEEDLRVRVGVEGGGMLSRSVEEDPRVQAGV